MENIQYDSIWELGCNCAAKRFSLLLTDGDCIDGPFSWASVSSPLLSLTYLTHPQYRQPSLSHITFLKGVYELPVDNRTGLVYSHQFNRKEEGNIKEREKKVIARMNRRWKRLLYTLNSPSSHPLFIWIGLGDQIIEPWQKEASQILFPYTNYSLPLAHKVISSLHNLFPADSKLLYMDYDPKVNKTELTYYSPNLLAYAHPYPYSYLYERHSTKDIVANIYCQIQSILPLKKSKNYSIAPLIELADSKSRCVKVKESSGKVYNYLFNLEQMKGRRLSAISPDSYQFSISSYSDSAVSTSWYNNKKERIYKKIDDLYVEDA